MSFKSLSQKNIIVVGLGVSGISVSLNLIKSKVNLFGWDDNYKTREKAKSLGIKVKNIEDIDFVTFGIHYNGGGTGTATNYKTFVTKNGDFRLG